MNNGLALLLLCIILPCTSLGDDRDSRATNRASHSIQAMIDSISAASVHASLDTLVGFQFRHTLDDTVSLTAGMGAARRWIYRKFQEFSQASGGRLQPEYFDFVATICGVTKLHRNVMAILPGTVTPDRYFIVSGHMDTRGDPNSSCIYNIFSPGANDDGSGTVISLELARVMSQYEFESSIIFMAVTGEDEGLVGSEAYAAWAELTGMRIDGMITNDVVGNIVGGNGIIDSTSVRHFSSRDEVTLHRQLSRYLKLTSEFYYPTMTINLIPDVDRPGRGGDHQSFQNHGYTAVRFTEPNENFTHQHSATDIVANMSPAYSARIARINVAGLASLANAPAKPPPPTLIDPGTGTSLIVEWSAAPEPDVAGYRIAVRDSGGLFYTIIVDAGNVTRDTVTSLTPGVPVYLGYSVYDTSGNESIFSAEILARPTIAPPAPANIQSTSLATTVAISWLPNVQLDVVRYRVERSTMRTGPFQLYDSVAAPTTTYSDPAMSPHVIYYYRVRAVDADGNAGPPSLIVPGRLATHDLGVLVVDGTRDGSGTPLAPTDAQVDLFYQALLANFQVGAEWDVTDSVVAGLSISDADMAAYSTIVWHTDVRGSYGVYRDTTAIRKYVQQGGRFFLCGWRLSGSLNSLASAGVTVYPPGSFVPEILKLDSSSATSPISQDFQTAVAVAPGFVNVKVDSIKIPTFGGALVNTDVALPPYADPSVQSLFTHRGKNPGSPFEGFPVGWRFLSGPMNVTVFDFPLYYMEEAPARAALSKALIDMGEPPLGVGQVRSGIPTTFALHQNYPNPFNPSTTIAFDIPVAGNVTLDVYDLLGQRVRTLVQQEMDPGFYTATWDGMSIDGTTVATGVYLYRLNVSGASPMVVVMKMLHLK